MKKNIVSIMLVVLAIILITTSLLLSYNKENVDNSSNNNSHPIENIDSEVIYSCKSMLEDERKDFISYLVEEIYVKNDIVIKTIPTMEIHFNNEELYYNLKNDDNYNKDKIFDDIGLIITFANGNETDLTKDINGAAISLQFSDYETDLAQVGYTCEKISNDF